jgi:hypothetical protein
MGELWSGDKYYGIHLIAAPPSMVVPFSYTNKDFLVLEPGWSITVTGERAHQDILIQLAPPAVEQSVTGD